MKKIVKFLQSRLFITGILILVQIIVLFTFIGVLANKFALYFAISGILSVLILLDIANSNMNPTFKFAWALPVIAFPVFGAPMYLLFAKPKQSYHIAKRFKGYRSMLRNSLRNNEDIINEIDTENPSVARQMRFIQKSAYAPVYKNTSCIYLPSGESYYSALKNELKKAEKFIFVEYFIIEQGEMFNSILEILKNKVEQGVEVRLMYDDIGTISKLPHKYDKYLESLGISVSVFNKMKPSLDAFLNYRDHRKIVVIDGKVGFTGGVNLADEYINAVEKFGHWKDSGIMLKGEAVCKLTDTFLQLWHFSKGESKIAYQGYVNKVIAESDGYIQPYADGPGTDDLTCELAYMGIINSASKYIHITTPYLILDNEMTTCLCHAAASGVDVKIITPHIPDKKTVLAVTRSNYRTLLQAGVRIYEYTPGFIHSKSIVADGEICVVGTANFDFRSFYHHFENCVLAYKSSCVSKVEADFCETLQKCQEITIHQLNEKGPTYALMQAILKVFSPLM